VRKAKILATIGPASNNEQTLEAMIAAGLNAVRINMSHGEYETHAESIRLAREISARLNRPLAVLVDLCGPKIRTGKLEGGKSVHLRAGQTFTITTREVLGNAEMVSTNYQRMAQDVTPDTRLLIDDGAIELRAEQVTETDIICRVINDGELSERKGINLPGVRLPIPSLTEKDRADLRWAVGQEADYIALSFVRSAEDCREALALIKEAGGEQPLVVKIEKAEAIENLDEIIAAANGVMVARGDLGVETSVEEVPVYQKLIIQKANQARKFVITATQMLQSMIDNPRPTRAEASDVANAVWDGTDCVMLSGETAMGKYPVASVSTMVRIIERAEKAREGSSNIASHIIDRSRHVSRALCEAAAACAEEMKTETTAVFTESGKMARRLSALRPPQRIVALTHTNKVCNLLALIWGVEALITPTCNNTDDMLRHGEATLVNAGVVTDGERVVFMAGRLSGLGLSSSVTLYRIGKPLEAR
jgi:pyruvate kinase